MGDNMGKKEQEKKTKRANSEMLRDPWNLPGRLASSPCKNSKFEYSVSPY